MIPTSVLFNRVRVTPCSFAVESSYENVSLAKHNVSKSRKGSRERCHNDHICNIMNVSSVGGSCVYYVTRKPFSALL